MSRLMIILCLGVLPWAPSFAADFYRWLDADGVLHIDTEKPKHVQSEKQTVDPERSKNGCETEKCRKNLQKLLGKRQPKAVQKPITSRVTTVKPTNSRHDNVQGTLQRFLQRKRQEKQKNTARYTVIKPNKNNQARVRRQFGSRYTQQRDNNADIVGRLLRKRSK